MRDITGADPRTKTMRGAVLRIGLKLKHFGGLIYYINRKLSDCVMSLVLTTPIPPMKTYVHVCAHTHTHTHTTTHNHTNSQPHKLSSTVILSGLALPTGS